MSEDDDEETEEVPEKEKIEVEQEKGILGAEVSAEMRKAYLDYAMSVIVSRAIPAIEDGLKPVQRRILHAMNLIGVKPGTQTKKSARIVGDTMGKFHPHGDMAIYATEGVITAFSAALMRYKGGAPDRCPKCFSYQISVVFRPDQNSDSPYIPVCESCGWGEVEELLPPKENAG